MESLGTGARVAARKKEETAADGLKEADDGLKEADDDGQKEMATDNGKMKGKKI